jgi:hypothetical protein
MKTKVGSDAAALLEQAAYVAAAVKEREVVTKDLEAETELRRERETELIQTKEELSEAQNEVTRLSQKCHELGTTVENLDLQLNHFVEFQEEAKILQTSAMARVESEMVHCQEVEKEAVLLRGKLDRAQLSVHAARNKAVLDELDNPIQLSFVSPLALFDSAIPVSSPVILPPARDRPVATPQKSVEKVRVRVTVAPIPKIFAPNLTPSRTSTPVTPQRQLPPLGPISQDPAPAARALIPPPNTFFYQRALGHARKQI